MRCEVDFDGSMLYSENSLCLLLDLLSDLATVLVPPSHVYHLFHVDPRLLFNPVEHMVVRSSYAELGEESVPIARDISE